MIAEIKYMGAVILAALYFITPITLRLAIPLIGIALIWGMAVDAEGLLTVVESLERVMMEVLNGSSY